MNQNPTPVPFREALKAWGVIALNSFGGPAAQIGVMHRVLVEERKWISEKRFLHALNYCMLLPGPEAMQLATYMGWLLHGYLGGLAAGTLFVLPGFLSILALSSLYVVATDVEFVAGLFFGLKAAVLAIVLLAVWRIGKKVLKHPLLVIIAASAFLALFAFQAPFPYVVLSAGMIGFVGARVYPRAFSGSGHASAVKEDAPGVVDQLIENGSLAHTSPLWWRDVAVALVFASLWFAPIFLLRLLGGPEGVLYLEGILFSKAAVLTFGGAYAVLPYISQQAVEVFGWLNPAEMMDGLGMAETTPGPLIQVVQFVGALGAWRNPGVLPPWLALLAGSWIATWVTFTPCFLWIFAGAPYIEAVSKRRSLAGALTAITAAVVGVVLNLALWFGEHVLFGRVTEWDGPLGIRPHVPEWASLDEITLLMSFSALIALARFKTGMIRTILVCALLGLLANHFIH